MKRSGLQFHMTVLYTLTTVVAVLLVEAVLAGTLILLIANGSLRDNEVMTSARQAARLYALAAAIRSGGTTLDPGTTFQPDRPASIQPPEENQSGDSSGVKYIDAPAPLARPVEFALVIAPGGRVLASSYPALYPAAVPIADLLPGRRSDLIVHALAGVPESDSDATPQGRVIGVAEPVWNRQKQVIGAVYVQVPNLPGGELLRRVAGILIVSAVFWLLLMTLVGGLFGLITTRGLVRRLRNLVAAMTRFADGDFTQRVPVTRRDELGQLEEQFNWMAEQLVESLRQRQALAGQNARLAERTRLARDLHDSVKQQVFAVTMQVGTALTLLDGQRDGVRQHLMEADTLAAQAQQELTALIQELRPLALQDKGLAVALQDYLTAWSRQRGIAVELHLSDAGVLPLQVEEALWRVAQEALANIARHSGATRVQVALAGDAHKVTLSVTDDGQGFDPATVNGVGVGLHSMRERMEAFDGTLTVQSRRGAGTCVVAQCPRLPVEPRVAETLAEGLGPAGE